MAPLFYRDADGAVLVFDLSKRDTYELVEKWLLELQSYAGSIKLVLVGNKCDATDQEVSGEEAKGLANKYGAKYIAASALAGININDIFSTLAIGKFCYIF